MSTLKKPSYRYKLQMKIRCFLPTGSEQKKLKIEHETLTFKAVFLIEGKIELQ